MELTPAAARSFLHTAFTPIWQQCEPIIRRVIGSRLSHHDAEDVVQTVALNIYRVLPEKLRKPNHRWGPYVTTATNNEVIRLRVQRAKDRRYSSSLEGRRDHALRAPHSEDGHPDTVTDADCIPDPFALDPLRYAIGAEITALIRPAFAALPPRQRAVVRSHLAGHTDEEIAASLGISASTVSRDRETAFPLLRPPLHTAGYAPFIPRHPELREGSVRPELVSPSVRPELVEGPAPKGH